MKTTFQDLTFTPSFVIAEGIVGLYDIPHFNNY